MSNIRAVFVEVCMCWKWNKHTQLMPNLVLNLILSPPKLTKSPLCSENYLLSLMPHSLQGDDHSRKAPTSHYQHSLITYSSPPPLYWCLFQYFIVKPHLEQAYLAQHATIASYHLPIKNLNNKNALVTESCHQQWLLRIVPSHHNTLCLMPIYRVFCLSPTYASV